VGPGVNQGFAVFAGVFEGCFGKSGGSWMVFCGELWWDVRQTWCVNGHFLGTKNRTGF
jgi:hypothetical protein